MHIDYEHITHSQSSREGGRIKIFVLHTTEGYDHTENMQDLKDLGALWDSEEASSHYGVNLKGETARYVPDKAKAWTQCYLNPVSLSVEQIAFSSFSRKQWMVKRHAQLSAVASLIQHAHVEHGVPIRRGYVVAGYVTRTGVCQHSQLGKQGCGHNDCGPAYPQEYVMLLARYYTAKARDPLSETTKKLRAKVNRVRARWGMVPAK